MTGIKRQLFVSLAIIAAAMSPPAIVSAGHSTPIYQAADDYREAVRDFERQVLRTRGVSSSIKRLVDDLEDSTSDLKSAARDPARFDRLMNRFADNDALHARVEMTFFGDPLCPPTRELAEIWIAVSGSYAAFTYELQYLQQLRNAKRGIRVPIVDHGFVPPFYPTPAYPTPAPMVGPPTRAYPESFYPSETAPLYRSQGYSTGPVLGGDAPSPALRPGGMRRDLQGPSGYPSGAQLERSGGSILKPSREVISTPGELRAAVTGALLQRE